MQKQQHVSSALNRLIVGANQNFDLHVLWQSTLRTLSNLDFEHQHEIQRVERSRRFCRKLVFYLSILASSR